MKSTSLITSIFIFLTLCLNTQLATAQNEDEKVKELVMGGILYLGKQDFPKAIEYLDQAIAIDSTESLLYQMRGEAKMNLGFKGENGNLTHNPKAYQAALADYDRSVILDPISFSAIVSRGYLHYLYQYFDLAIADFDVAETFAKTTKERHHVFNLRGIAKMHSKNPEGAILDLLEAIKINPNAFSAHSNLALIYAQQGNHEQSEKYYRTILEATPNNMEVMHNLAFLKLRMGDYEESLKLFEDVLKMHPENGLTYNNMGFAKLKLGRLDDALNDINKSLKLYPENSYAYRNRAMVFIEMGKKEKACADLLRANELGYSKSYGNEVNELLEKHCQ